MKEKKLTDEEFESKFNGVINEFMLGRSVVHTPVWEDLDWRLSKSLGVKYNEQIERHSNSKNLLYTLALAFKFIRAALVRLRLTNKDGDLEFQKTYDYDLDGIIHRCIKGEYPWKDKTDEKK